MLRCLSSKLHLRRKRPPTRSNRETGMWVQLAVGWQWCKHYVNEHPRNLSGYFRWLSTTIIDCFGLRQSSKTLTIISSARYRQLVNTIMLMNTLAILQGTFGNFRPLSLTTSTCVNLHRDLYHYLESALSPTCEHYNVNEHPRNPSGYFSVTFDHYCWLLRLASIFIETYH